MVQKFSGESGLIISVYKLHQLKNYRANMTQVSNMAHGSLVYFHRCSKGQLTAQNFKNSIKNNECSHFSKTGNRYSVTCICHCVRYIHFIWHGEFIDDFIILSGYIHMDRVSKQICLALKFSKCEKKIQYEP
jgi:hypothetical protein